MLIHQIRPRSCTQSAKQLQDVLSLLSQWQAQPLGPAKGRHPTVGAKSMPDFLVAQTGGKAGKAARNQVLFSAGCTLCARWLASIW